MKYVYSKTLDSHENYRFIINISIFLLQGLSIKHVMIRYEENKWEVMDLLGEDKTDVQLCGETIKPFRFTLLQDNSVIQIGTISLEFMEDEDEFICDSPGVSLFKLECKNRQKTAICIPDTEAFNETLLFDASGNNSSVEFIPETQTDGCRYSGVVDIGDSDTEPNDFLEESQSIFSPPAACVRPSLNSVDNFIASFNQPDSDDEELAKMSDMAVTTEKSHPKSPVKLQTTLSPKVANLKDNRSFSNVSTTGNAGERSKKTKLPESELNDFENDREGSKTPDLEFLFAL